MSDSAFWDVVADAILDSAEFADEHPWITLTLAILSLAGAATLSGDDDEPQTTFNPTEIENGQSQQIDQLQAALNDIQEQHKHIPRTVEEFLQHTDRILQTLEESKRGKLLYPDFQDDINHLKSIRDLLKHLPAEELSKQTQSAANLYRQAHAMEADYLAYEERWSRALNEWTATWNQVHHLIEDNRQILLPVYTTEGQENVKIDCAFWSRGALEEAAQNLPPLEQPEDTPIEDLATLIQQAQILFQRVEEIIQQAQQDFLATQVRIQISESVCDQLERRGWYIEKDTDYAFEKADEREPLNLKLLSPVGDQLEFVFKPDGAMMMRPKFQGVHNRGVIEQLARVLQTSLQNNGISIQEVAIT